jgi:hypothetical protein
MESLELETIKEDFKKALSFESPINRFNALIGVARLTDSSDLPSFLKDRINKRVVEKQHECVGLKQISMSGLFD